MLPQPGTTTSWSRRIIWRLSAAAPVLAVLSLAAGAADVGELVRQGREQYGAGNWAAAVDLFRQALTEDPGSKEAREGLQESMVAEGHSLIQAGNWVEARRAMEGASNSYPEDARFPILLGIVLFRQGDYSYARYAVRQALALAPDDPVALELSGDLYYQEGSFNLAIPEWEKALEKTPGRPSLRQKIERTRGEEKVEEGLERDSSRHFVMQYDEPVPREVAREVLRELESAFDRIEEDLGNAPRGDISVILYPRMVFQQVTRSPEWVGGRFDGKVRVPVGGLARDADVARLRPTLAHELTHAFLRSMVPQGLPLWLEEGLAEHFEGMPAEMAREVVRRSGAKFASLEEVSRGLRGGGNVEAAYAAALLAVEVLFEEGGTTSVRRMLEDMGSGVPLDKAMETEFRLTPGELEDTWKRSLP